MKIKYFSLGKMTMKDFNISCFTRDLANMKKEEAKIGRALEQVSTDFVSLLELLRDTYHDTCKQRLFVKIVHPKNDLIFNEENTLFFRSIIIEHKDTQKRHILNLIINNNGYTMLREHMDRRHADIVIGDPCGPSRVVAKLISEIAETSVEFLDGLNEPGAIAKLGSLLDQLELSCREIEHNLIPNVKKVRAKYPNEMITHQMAKKTRAQLSL